MVFFLEQWRIILNACTNCNFNCTVVVVVVVVCIWYSGCMVWWCLHVMVVYYIYFILVVYRVMCTVFTVTADIVPFYYQVHLY